jgi:hypothetical protein
MSQLKKCTAIKALLMLALFWAAGASWAAQVAGTIVHLSGPLLAKKADGAVRILSARSEVESGDTLVTEKNTYAMVKFIDNSEITLKPSTTFKVDNFSYDAAKPDGDNASFSLVKGGLRSVTGLLGKRNKEKFAMKTPSATIGIRGTTFTAVWVEASPRAVAAREAWLMASTAGLGDTYPLQPLMLAQANRSSTEDAASPSTLEPGLHTAVSEGEIDVKTPVGTLPLKSGESGLAPDNSTMPTKTPPGSGPDNTELIRYGTQPPPSPSSTKAPGKSNSVDCEVR